ncbi:hypothetical protein [Paucibacter soli]|uniref:hypothetical protein n=1 Tax=Paucibacter soli TaxID=3133433 RepID=UPI00309D0F1D
MNKDFDLFAQDRSPTSHPVAPKKIDLGKVIQDAMKVADRDPLSDTVDAIRRIPEELRPQVERIAEQLYKDAFVYLYERAYAIDGGLKTYGTTPNSLNHSAKLAAMSAVGGFALEPWHMVDAAALSKIADALVDAESFQPAIDALSTIKGVNLFVAATEADDRDSYLKAVKAMLKRHRVRQLVFDAELVEWRPASDFLEACSIVNIGPAHVGIATRDLASKHSIMATSRMTGVPALYVDSGGRQMVPDSTGRLELPALAQGSISTPRQAAAPQARIETPLTEARDAQGLSPSLATKDRLANLRSAQQRYRARP